MLSPSLFKILLLVVVVVVEVVSPQKSYRETDSGNEDEDDTPYQLSNNQTHNSTGRTFRSSSASSSRSSPSRSSTIGLAFWKVWPVSTTTLVLALLATVFVVVIIALMLWACCCKAGRNPKTSPFFSKSPSKWTKNNLGSLRSLMKTQSLSWEKSSPSVKLKSVSPGNSSCSSSNISSNIQSYKSSSPRKSGVLFNSADRSPVRINPPPSTISNAGWSSSGFLAPSSFGVGGSGGSGGGASSSSAAPSTKTTFSNISSTISSPSPSTGFKVVSTPASSSGSGGGGGKSSDVSSSVRGVKKSPKKKQNP